MKDQIITDYKKNYEQNDQYFQIVWEGLPQNVIQLIFFKNAFKILSYTSVLL